MSTNKEISFSEFKMWLQGVEEMQEGDWTPSAVQWKKIKEKISTVNPQLDRTGSLPSEQQRPTRFTPAQSEYMEPPQQPRFQAPAPPPPEFFDQDLLQSKIQPKPTQGTYSTPFK